MSGANVDESVMRLICTRRLQLEPLQARHADEMFVGLSDLTLYSWIDERPPQSVATLRDRYERLQSRSSPDGTEAWLNWAIRDVDDQKVVGYVQATVRQDRAFIAYVIFSSAQRRGYGHEAVSAMLTELHEYCAVSKFCATVDARNHPSLSLLVGLGFRKTEEVDGEILMCMSV
jgi:ribosomal-protein-alanine N-acetyltransferase